MFNETVNNQVINITVNAVERLDPSKAARMMGVSEDDLNNSRLTGAIDGMPAPAFSVTFYDNKPRYFYLNTDIMYWLLGQKTYVAHSDDMKKLYTKERNQEAPYDFKTVPFLK